MIEYSLAQLLNDGSSFLAGIAGLATSSYVFKVVLVFSFVLLLLREVVPLLGK